MKKIKLSLWIISLVLIASIGLTACGDEASQAPAADAPAADAPAVPAADAAAAPAAAAPAATGGNSVADLGFRPETNGFPFENYGSGNYVNLTPEDMNRIYGDVVCANKVDGKCALTPPSDQWMQQTNDAMSGGHCYGMAQASLLFFQNKLAPADFSGTAITDFKLDGNEKLQREIAFNWSGQKLDKVRQGAVGGKPNDVLDKVIESLKAGPSSEVYVAGFFKSDGSGGHAVTPYAVEDRGNGVMALMIYDNNYPGKPREMLFDRNANSWSYEASTNPSVASQLYTGDATTQSFFIFPVSPAIQQSACPFCSGGVAAKKGNGLASTVGAQNEIYLDGAADLLITDENGKKLGRVDGKIVNEIPGASYEVPMAAFDSDIEPVYNVPTSINLTMAIDGSRLKEAALTDVVVIGPGYDLGVEGIGLDPGQVDELTVQSTEKIISYRTDSSESPTFIIGLEREGADFEFELQGADIEGGGRINILIDPKTGDLLINADEIKKDGKFYLSMTRIDDTSEENFTNDEIILKSGAILYIDFAEWKGNGTPVKMGIDTNGDGILEEEYTSADEQ
ncbi:MAG: hypothetical protein WCG34_10780 [Leptolinea sp.]